VNHLPTISARGPSCPSKYQDRVLRPDHLVFNNNRSNYAVVNGLQMAEILELGLPGHG
jgi:hypothetical protein